MSQPHHTHNSDKKKTGQEERQREEIIVGIMMNVTKRLLVLFDSIIAVAMIELVHKNQRSCLKKKKRKDKPHALQTLNPN